VLKKGSSDVVSAMVWLSPGGFVRVEKRMSTGDRHQFKPAKTLGKDGKDRPFQNNEAAYFEMDGCAIARGAPAQRSIPCGWARTAR